MLSSLKILFLCRVTKLAVLLCGTCKKNIIWISERLQIARHLKPPVAHIIQGIQNAYQNHLQGEQGLKER